MNSVKVSKFSLNSASHNWLQTWCYTLWTHFSEKWQQLILEIYVRAIISERKVSKDWRFNWTKEPDKTTQKVWRDNDLCQSPGMWSCVDKKWPKDTFQFPCCCCWWTPLYTIYNSVYKCVLQHDTRLQYFSDHRAPTQSVWVADCYLIASVLDLPFASPMAIYR